MVHLTDLITIQDLEDTAAVVLPQAAHSYFMSGADEEQTIKENERAYNRFLFLPSMMVDPTNISMKISIFGNTYSMPIAFAPCAMHKLAHPEGEKATVKVAVKNNICMVLSTLSTTSIEQIAEMGGHEKAGLWFQLYMYRNRDLTKALLERVEAQGFQAIVFTVDAPVFGRRLADCRSRFQLPPHLKLPNFEGMRAADLPGNAPTTPKSAPIFNTVSEFIDPSITWESLTWLKANTKLPVLVKGVMCAEDAEKAVALGADGVVVSNHGGRQLDGVPATIEALPMVAKAVAGRIPVLVDGGIRRGSDVLKALALGATMVLIGRPVIFGLAVAGADGVQRVVEIYKDELTRAMALSGAIDTNNVPQSLVIHRRKLEKMI